MIVRLAYLRHQNNGCYTSDCGTVISVRKENRNREKERKKKRREKKVIVKKEEVVCSKEGKFEKTPLPWRLAAIHRM